MAETMTRKSLLSRAGRLAAAVAATGVLPRTLFSESAKPNIIFILIDDLRWDHLSCMGHPFVKTPNIDRLAREGVHFTNAFCTTSLCSPSRASFLTGNYAHTHGVKDNLTPWDNDKNRTFFEGLKKAGYRNAFIGKWHMPGRIPKLPGRRPFHHHRGPGRPGALFQLPAPDRREEHGAAW